MPGHYHAPRHVFIQDDQQHQPNLPPLREPLSDFRNKSAWVLLGEPGAGKSEVFQKEAEATGNIYMSVADFLSDPTETAWKSKTLFLDGLDETRSGTAGGDTLRYLRARLKKLGSPRFRIACRAADWYGASDTDIIKSASTDGQWLTLCLEPLDNGEILDILARNHQIADPTSFMREASDLGLGALLDNPQTLSLLAQSVRDGHWPDSRQQTYELACAKLADEESRPHRRNPARQNKDIEAILNSAGQLCCTLLLTDKSGIALERDRASERFPALEDFSPPDPQAAQLATRSNLFRLAGSERVTPTHRSIAEFLAARWLGKQIDLHDLPLGRVLNLMLGYDGRTIAGLRGLYAWLALHCRSARQQLIGNDPLTVLIYGDVKLMTAQDKRLILSELRREISKNFAVDRSFHSRKPLGALADPALADDFKALLESPERDDASQSFLGLVLDILNEGPPIPALAEKLSAVVTDDTRWTQLPSYALTAWLSGKPDPAVARKLLDDINAGKISDPDDQLSGLLLSHLYPAYLPVAVLPDYLHPRKRDYFSGRYGWFWSHGLIESIPDADLPVLLDQLAARKSLAEKLAHDFRFQRMYGGLLVKGIESHGDAIDDAHLMAWLGIGADEYGSIQRDAKDQAAISTWLSQRPERYKSLLGYLLNCCKETSDFHHCIFRSRYYLDTAAAPSDIGLWHLDRASQEQDDTLAQHHLNEAFSALMQERGNAGLSLELFEQWAENNPERSDWLNRWLSCEIEPWRIEQINHKNQRKQQHAENRNARTRDLSEHLDAIREGRAYAGIMHQLAGVWLNHFSDIHGNTLLERFESYCNNPNETLAAAEAGFSQCPMRDDLPEVADIIRLRTQQSEHYIRSPCLIGMDLRWQKDPALLQELSEERKQKMVAFRLTYDIDDDPAWYRYLIREQPTSFADLFVSYVVAMLKARCEGIAGVHLLAREPDFRNLAMLVVPRILAAFPIRANERQLHTLETLLKAALNLRLPVHDLIDEKTARKSLDAPQKTLWLATGLIMDASRYETRLWKHIGKSAKLADTLSWFISDRFSELAGQYALSPYSLGRLIELQTPHADFGRVSGFVGPAARRGDQVRTLINRLGAHANSEAADELERLRQQPALQVLRFSLDNALNELRQKQRENSFAYPNFSSVIRTLANGEPASAADLTALTLDHLDDLARRIRTDNADLFRQFWNEPHNKKEFSPKPENSCRDVLLHELRHRLNRFGLDVQPEGDQFNDKRADIRISFRTEFELPIEIKRQSNDELWTALRRQLIEQYCITPKTAGHGVYLILWFNDKDTYRANDGGAKPKTPEELRQRLKAQLTPEERRRIQVRVLDVSWP